MTRAQQLSETMRIALRLAASDAGLWAHTIYGAGFYKPGAGTVSISHNTIRALERRGLVELREAAMDHEVVYVQKVLERGSPGKRVFLTEAGRVIASALEVAQAKKVEREVQDHG